ncbi:hypothetical protein [Reyranella sp.]|uniref:hypothetical protein n=1 Tax=Reyranella sp. TaxID=1929291 RepID=UPI003F6E5456
MDTERLWLEVALRDLTPQGKDAVLRAIAEIKTGMAEASKAADLKDGIANAETFGKTLGSVAKTAAGVFTGIKLADLTKDLGEFHKSAMAGVAGLAPLADRLGVTTDELQALQGAARRANVTNDELNKTVFTFTKNVGDASQGNKAAVETFEKLGIKIRDQHGNLRPMPDLLMETSRSLMQVENTSLRASIGAGLLGEKGARLTPLLRELGVPIGDLVERGKSFGEIVDSEVVAKLDRAKNASEAAQQQYTALYATLAAPIHAAGLEYIAQLTADLTKRIREAKGESGGLIEQMNRLFGGWDGKATMGGLRLSTPAEANQDELVKLRQRLVQQEKDRADPKNAGRTDLIDQEIAALKAQLAARVRDKTILPQVDYEGDEMSARRGGAVPPGLSNLNPFKTGGTSNPRVAGGGGGSNRDRIGEAVNQLRGEVEAAQAAYDALMKDTKTPLEDLEREVELRKKIADELAKLGKYDPKDPRVAQIRDLVRGHEELEVKIKQREEAMKVATETERRMGDGQAYLAAEMRRLNEALDTGRLSYEAYGAAAKEANEKAGDMDRKLRGSRGGADGVMAGAEQAMKDWERANSSFETGKRLMNDGFNLLKQASNDWATTGVLDLNKYGQAFISMLANVGMALAQSEIMKMFGLTASGGGGGGGGLGGGIMGLFGGGASGTGSGLFDGVMSMFNFFPTFAEGGDYQAGVPRIVGEKGWELDIPNTSGTILNQRQLANLLGGGGERRSQSMAQRLGLDVRVSLDSDLLRAEIRDEAGTVVATAAPQIEGRAVKRAGDQVVPITNRHEAESGGDWRLAR